MLYYKRVYTLPACAVNPYLVVKFYLHKKKLRANFFHGYQDFLETTQYQEMDYRD